MSTRAHTCASARAHVCIYEDVHTHICVGMYMLVNIYTDIYTCRYVHTYMYMYNRARTYIVQGYGVATGSRIDKLFIGLFCRIASLL